MNPPRPRLPTTKRSAPSEASTRTLTGCPRTVLSVTDSGEAPIASTAFRRISLELAERSTPSVDIRPPGTCGTCQALTASTAAPVRAPWLSAHLRARADAGEPSTPTTMRPAKVVPSVVENHLSLHYSRGTIRTRLRTRAHRLCLTRRAASTERLQPIAFVHPRAAGNDLDHRSAAPPAGEERRWRCSATVMTRPLLGRSSPSG